jgi:hypothetical protein
MNTMRMARMRKSSTVHVEVTEEISNLTADMRGAKFTSSHSLCGVHMHHQPTNKFVYSTFFFLRFSKATCKMYLSLSLCLACVIHS